MTEVVANDLVLLADAARVVAVATTRQFARIVVLVLGGRQQLRPERAGAGARAGGQFSDHG